MPNILDHVAYLSQEIGARPAGTEEEQQAALYITEQLQKEAGLSTVIEDFNGVSNPTSTLVGLAVVSAALAVASMFLSVLIIPAIIITIIAAVLTALERLGRPVLSNIVSRGVSQNVVAQYRPEYSHEGPGLRRRKVVIVAHYDSGKVRAEMGGALVNLRPALNWAAFGAMVAIPLFLIIRYVGFIHAAGALAIVLNVITVILAILALLPAIFAIIHKIAPYNEAANCNASGVAVMLDIASRIGRGRVSEAEIEHGSAPIVHGERAARESGVVPEGADLVYEAPVTADEPVAGTADGLAAAKDAIAALTGRPVSASHPVSDISGNLVQVKEQPIPAPTDEDIAELRADTREALTGAGAPEAPFDEPAEMGDSVGAGEAEPAQEGAATEGAMPAAAAASAVAAVATAAPSVPAWYIEAQRKAKRQEPSGDNVHRSRYADAIAAFEAESAAARQEQQPVETELSSQIRQLQENINGVKAPHYDRTVTAVEEPALAPSEGAAPAESAGQRQAPAEPAEPVADAAPEAAPAERLSRVELPSQPPKANRVQRHPLSEWAAEEAAIAAAADAATVEEESPAAAAESAQPASSKLSIEGIPLFADDDAAEIAAVPPTVAVELPDLGENAPQAAPVAESAQQRAPLADATESDGKKTAKSLLSMLPSLSGSFDAVSTDDDEPAPAGGRARRHDRAGMRTTLPSLSGSITRQGLIDAEAAAAAAPSASAAVPSAGTAGMTGAFAPVGGELLKDADADDIFVDDADDSAYDTDFTESGAFAGPGYVEMPKSRLGGFFGRFKRDKGTAHEETTPQQWLDVDDDFDAREVGKERGSWESFRQDADEAPVDADLGETTAWSPDAVDDADLGATTAWSPVKDEAAEAGAYAESDGRASEAARGGYGHGAYDRSDGDYGSWNSWSSGGADSSWGGEIDDAWTDDADEYAPVESERPQGRRRSRRWHGGAFSRLRLRKKGHGDEADAGDEVVPDRYDEIADEAAPDAFVTGAGEVSMRGRRKRTERSPREEAQIDRELEQIYRFRNPDIATEVWFVALGSELAGHSGMKAFIAEHEQELRGAIVVEIEALGAGELSFIEREGTYVKRAVSSRMQRYVNKACRETGMSVPKAKISWGSSSASYALGRGIQAIHLVGVENGKPALCAEADDVVGNIDEQKLADASDFLISFIKNI